MKKYRLILLPFAALFFVATFTHCSSTKKSSTTVKAHDPNAPHYEVDVAPIISQHCSPCHFPDKGGRVASLASVDDLKRHASAVLKRINKNEGEPGFMPAKNKKLSQADIATIQKWQDGGMQ